MDSSLCTEIFEELKTFSPRANDSLSKANNFYHIDAPSVLFNLAKTSNNLTLSNQISQSQNIEDLDKAIAAVQRNYLNLRLISKQKQFDPDFMTAVLKENVAALNAFDNEVLKNDKIFLLEIIKHDGTAIQYISDDLKKDRELAIAAVQQNGQALQFLPKFMKNDQFIVREAVKQCGWAIAFSDPQLRRNVKFVTEMISINGNIIQFVDTRFRKKKNFILEAIKHNENALCFADETLKEDKEFLLEAEIANKKCGRLVQKYLKKISSIDDGLDLDDQVEKRVHWDF